MSKLPRQARREILGMVLEVCKQKNVAQPAAQAGDF